MAAVVSGLFLLQADNNLLEVKVDNTSKKTLLSVFEKYFMADGEVPNYAKLYEYDIDDDTQRSFYKTEGEIPNFGEIKTNIVFRKQGTIKVVSLNSFGEIRGLSIKAWILHVQNRDDATATEKHILLFQSFHKANMYVSQSFWDTKLSLLLTDK